MKQAIASVSLALVGIALAATFPSRAQARGGFVVLNQQHRVWGAAGCFFRPAHGHVLHPIFPMATHASIQCAWGGVDTQFSVYPPYPNTDENSRNTY